MQVVFVYLFLLQINKYLTLQASYQCLVLLLLATAHHLREVDKRSSHVVTLGFFMGILVLNLKSKK